MTATTPTEEHRMNSTDVHTDTGRIAVSYTHEGRVATVLIDRPRKLNAVTLELLDDLYTELRAVENSDAQLVLLKTAGEKAFCVGADITQFADFTPVQMWKRWIAEGHRVFNFLAQLRQPTIAVVDGIAVGGGLELALACDLRVGGPGARLGLPETSLGTIPGWGGTERLTNVIGAARTKELIFTRRQLDAETALAWGLLTAVAERDGIDAATTELVDRILEGAPAAVQVSKQLVDAAAAGAPSAILEALASGFTASTHDFAIGVTAFRNKTTPIFTNS
ncbi:enoyl-CoA hydratase/isomerase family protein [Rhodococcus opacus]|uniref:enoyl-CoA hydratase/isomerase family protein n=1 Tax=Rhodococcus opacus TaxID=37919 RepID=UPI0002DA26B7|nr:enoyl-CoA hydratase/isomerase family protein [Rhodococcus opacus]AHK30855.1 3-hydroxypropionyl-coenzyme A dehydratase [Rhodococcus opacus PD630]